MNDGAKIVLHDEDGGTLELYVIEETRINNVDYLLAADSEEDGAEAYILKDMSAPEEEEAVYSIVEEPEEIEYIGKIFAELLDDADIGLE